MNNRWKMNRIGFVNFWLYDEEVFTFADGKLLLRGANASGKSITTQSFIPFILDGDKSPERLDPFGSKDRRMEYYFLGEGEKDDVTGYLFLEFKKADTDQYRTIGIGQRAQRGKAMTFWGFVLHDGRRIGYDFKLYKEAGSKKLPLSRQELANLLGPENPIKTSQREYMEMVNQYIFGFPRLDQYDQFVRLMIKVRAPKLSRDFKPSKVCEILNASLQILSDEDLRTMVEAMEKIEDIQTKLEGLRSAFKDAGIIKREYDRYNQFVLGKKAEAYLQAKDGAAALQKEAEKLEATQAENEQALTEKEALVERLGERNETLQHEKTVLDAADLENSVQKLQQSREQAAVLEKNILTVDQKIEKYQDDIRSYDAAERKESKNLADIAYQIETTLKQLKEIDEILQFPQQERVLREFSPAVEEHFFTEIRDSLKLYRAMAQEGLAALRQLKEAHRLWDRAEEAASGARVKKGEKDEQQQNALALEAQARSALQDAFYRLAKNSEQLCFTEQELRNIIGWVEKYQGLAEADMIKQIVDGRYQAKSSELLNAKLALDNQQELARQAHAAGLAELTALKEAKDLPPVRSEKVTQARKILAANHIVCLPFYEAVSFAETLSAAERDLLEEELEDAGILDALVVAPADVTRAQKLLREASDTLLVGNGISQMFPFDKLIPAAIAPELQSAVEDLLLHIAATENEDVALVLSDDGYFRNGLLKGHSVATKPAAFIGVRAREEQRQRKIAEKEALCEQLRQEWETWSSKAATAQQALATLAEEYRRVPAFADLSQGIALVREAQYEMQKALEELTAKEQDAEQALAAQKAAEQAVIVKCRSLPLERRIETYEEALRAADDYASAFYDLSSRRNEDKVVRTKLQSIEERRENKAEALDSESRQRRNFALQLKKYAGEIKQLEEFLNQPETQAMAKRLEAITRELQANGEAIRENEKAAAALQADQKHFVESAARIHGQLLRYRQDEKKALEYYSEELALGFVLQAEERSAAACAPEARDHIREADQNKSIVELTSNLLKTYQQHSSNLSSYGTSVEECFAEAADGLRRRQRIVSTWQGKKLSFMDFYDVLQEAIESTELLIQEKDRKLFEDILTDTLSRKLNSRILESRNWIRDMSALMENMDTSMGLTFSLEWKAQKSLQNEEIDTQELEKLLNRDRNLLTKEDIEKVSAHFRSKIATARRAAEESGIVVNYSDLIRDALDYRKWFDLKLLFRRSLAPKKELTNNFFNTFSGGEKAMAMYIPLFAAVSSQYKKAEKEDCPRVIALDEAFAGVDEKNISSMFALVDELDFDYIMNSQALWGCYESVKSLRIAELLRPANAATVTVIFYHWNGKERMLDEA